MSDEPRENGEGAAPHPSMDEVLAANPYNQGFRDGYKEGQAGELLGLVRHVERNHLFLEHEVHQLKHQVKELFERVAKLKPRRNVINKPRSRPARKARR